jgi:hypothetical protein
MKTSLFDIPLTRDEQTLRILDFFAAAALYFSVERSGDSDTKLTIVSDFWDNDDEKVFYGEDLHNCATNAASEWMKQTLHQTQALEAIIRGMRIYHALDNTVDPV